MLSTEERTRWLKTPANEYVPIFDRDVLSRVLHVPFMVTAVSWYVTMKVRSKREFTDLRAWINGW